MTPITILEIQRMVAARLHVTVEELKERARARDLVMASQVAIYLTRMLAGASLQETARHFGGCHHTNVMYSTTQIARLRLANREIDQLLMKLQNILEGVPMDAGYISPQAKRYGA